MVGRFFFKGQPYLQWPLNSFNATYTQNVAPLFYKGLETRR